MEEEYTMFECMECGEYSETDFECDFCGHDDLRPIQ
ncbi:hypothetical protein KAMAJI_00110 [Serratia phage vB_SmaM-Kamaji]|nr:hypothetical protein KAMAJI_00110 [Serratia phage vB_SmaM-Kamaji]